MSSVAPEQDLLASIENGDASRRILEFAARGFVPLAPAELVRAVGSIIATGDPELAPLAEETFRGFEAAALKGAVQSATVRAEQLDVIARRTHDNEVLERLLLHRAVSDDTLTWLAERVGPWLQDVLVTNQIRLLAAPIIVERLFENPQLSSDIRRRADEFLEEFFLKKERERDELEAAAAAAAAEDEALRAAAAQQQAQLASVLPEAEEDDLDSPGREVQLPPDDDQSLVARLSTLSVAQRVQLAYRGTKEERLFLVRDNNRLVSMAVLKSPKTRDADAQIIANMKNVSEDVLRTIGQRRDWLRRYSILSALVKNPRSPIDVTVPLVIRLQPRDVRVLAKDRNVPEAVRVSAKRIAARYET